MALNILLLLVAVVLHQVAGVLAAIAQQVDLY
jgi:hypothetical protein